MDIVKIGILSSANIATRSMIPTLKTLPDHYEVVGIASRNTKKANELAEFFNIEAFSDYQSLVKDNRLNAIYIPLPTGLHYHWVKASLENGKHVLVEKSLACTFEEVEELQRIAKSKKLVVFENFQFRFHKQFQVIKDLLIKRKLGEIRHFQAYFGFPPFSDEDNIRYKRELGGGALLDAGAYTVKISQLLLGLGLKVKASSLNMNLTYGVETWGSAILEASNSGILASLAFGFDHQYRCGIDIWGSKGSLSTNRLFTAPPNYSPTINLILGSEESSIAIEPENHFRNMLLHFYLLVNGVENVESEYEQNLDQARILKEIHNLAYAK